MKLFNTVEEAFEALGLDPALQPDVSMLPEKDRQPIIDHYKLTKVIEAHNDGWTPNWNDHNEYKYFPWFEVKASKKQPSGFGFSRTLYSSTRTGTDIGSRLCLRSRELALHVGKTFADLYQGYFLIK